MSTRSKRPSQMEQARRRGKLLEYIMAWKRQELPKQMAEMPLDQVKAFAQVVPEPLDLAAALTAQPGVSLIAEVKRASPSKGLIARDWDPERIAETYARNGAAAISCLTDARFFQGKLAYLTAIKERLQAINRPVPVLRKDFLFHEYQIYESRMAGADAVLLIVAVLGDRQLRELLELTHQLGMQALVEVHDPAEVERALAVDARIIGINNRDLRTFTVDLETTAQLRALIPEDRVVVSESGIRSPEDVGRVAEMGVDAILVGETFCKLPQGQRGAAVREFVRAGRKTKKEKRGPGEGRS